MREYIIGPDLPVKAELMQCGPYLGIHTGKNDTDTALFGTPEKVAQVPDARRIHERHLSHTDDTDLHSGLPAFLQFFQTACETEKERAVDFVDLDAGRNVKMLGIVQLGNLVALRSRYMVIVKHFDGLNDGLVAVDSARWGERFTLLEPKGKRGISHGDVVDLNRENIPGFDVREFYVSLAADLKRRGF